MTDAGNGELTAPGSERTISTSVMPMPTVAPARRMRPLCEIEFISPV
jgi:hypothetical protein